MRYTEAVGYLDGLTSFGIKPGLDRIRMILEELDIGRPGSEVVLVGGTNGKGSTCMMLESLVRHSGLSTGSFVKPHLLSPTERIMIDGVPVSEASFARNIGEIVPVAEQMADDPPTYFETILAASLLQFFRTGVDVAIVEVGMGGTWDATNVLEADVSAITNVTLDHTDVLGPDIRSIAGEKAGIMKGEPLVTGATGDALDVLEAKAGEVGSRMVRLGQGVQAEVVRQDDWRYVIDVLGIKDSYTDIPLCLNGRFQVDNAAIAVAVAELLMPSAPEDEVVRQALSNVVWPGRMQVIEDDPVIMLDGAHNPGSAAALAREIGIYRDWSVVFGSFRDKDHRKVLEALAPVARNVITTSSGAPRSEDPEVLERTCRDLDLKCRTILDPNAALAEAVMSGSQRILVTGSLSLVGEVLKRHSF